MEKLNFPTYKFNIIKSGQKLKIFDSLRKKYLVLTPEEWVRQHCVNFLAEQLLVPYGFIKLEMQLDVNKLQRRADIVVYNNQLQPILIVECKAPQINISQKTFDQIARYNLALKVPYLMVTNGLNHFYCKINIAEKSFNFLPQLPLYNDLL